MDIKIAQQMTITELVLENQKLKQECDDARTAFVILEQERDEARSELSLKQQTLTIAEGTLADLRNQRDEWSAMCGKYKQERDTLIQKLDAWQEIAEHLHHFVQYPAWGVDQATQRMDVLEAYKHLKKCIEEYVELVAKCLCES